MKTPHVVTDDEMLDDAKWLAGLKEWVAYIYNPKLDMTLPQRVAMAEVLLSGFEDFNSIRVVADLLANRKLWDAVCVMQTGTADSASALVKLRDLPMGINNANTIFLTSDKKRLTKMDALARTWNPHELLWLDKEAPGLLGDSGTKSVILKLWWN